MDELSLIGKSCNTDKNSHGFLPFYEQHLRDIRHNVRDVLEIGVQTGESLMLWEAYFPQASITGLDHCDKASCRSSKVKLVRANQESRPSMQQALGDAQFDLIIDDGGHHMRQQQISLGYLFQRLRPGGIYILEDLHTSAYGASFNYHNDTKSYDVVKQLRDTGKVVSTPMTPEEIAHLEANVASVDIWTRTPDLVQSVTSLIKKKS